MSFAKSRSPLKDAWIRRSSVASPQGSGRAARRHGAPEAEGRRPAARRAGERLDAASHHAVARVVIRNPQSAMLQFQRPAEGPLVFLLRLRAKRYGETAP